jgi:aspartate racemase
MNHAGNKTIGIVGGMGPQAGIALLNSITCMTGAGKDQEHLSTILMSFPGDVEDRTLFLEGNAVSNPAYTIANIISRLEIAGADVIGIACNTSHAPRIYNVITEELKKAASKVRLINMPFETCRYLKDNGAQVSRVGVLSTNGTYRCGVYNNILHDMGFDVIIPEPEFQNDVIHAMVYDARFGIKSNAGSITNEVNVLMRKALAFFKEKKTDAIILGCTEFSLMPFGNQVNGMLVVDSTEAMARALIKEATHVPDHSKQLVSI